MHVMRDARAKARIGLEKSVHAVLIARKNHSQVVALILHHLQQDLDCFLPVVLLILWAVQVVGLVNEEHAAHSALQYVFGLGCGMADVLADKIVARNGDQMSFTYESEAMKDARHAQRDRRLAGPRIA